MKPVLRLQRYNWLRRQLLVKYSRKVSAIILVSVVTSSMWKKTSTESTFILYIGESDSEDSGNGYKDAVENEATGEGVGNLFRDAVNTIRAEISALDLVDFDENLLVVDSINE